MTPGRTAFTPRTVPARATLALVALIVGLSLLPALAPAVSAQTPPTPARPAAPDAAFARELVAALSETDSVAFETLLPLEADVRWYIANRVPRTVIRDDPATFADPAEVHTELVEQLREDFRLWREIAQDALGLPLEGMRYLDHAVVADPIADEFQSHVLRVSVAIPFPGGVELLWEVKVSAMEVGGRFVASFWFPQYDGFLERRTAITDEFVDRVVTAVYTSDPGFVASILPEDDDIRWFLEQRLARDLRPQIAEFGLESGVDRRRLGEWLALWGSLDPMDEVERLRSRVAELAAGRRIDDARAVQYCLPLAEGYPLFSHAFEIEVRVLYDTGEEVPYAMLVGAMQGPEALYMGSHPAGADVHPPFPGSAPCPI